MPQYSGVYTLSQVAEAVKNQTWVNTAPPNIEYLVIAGGGGGAINRGGGGGAGGLLTGLTSITPGSAITVTVGAGGAGRGTNGQGLTGNNSVFGSLTAIAGGGGGDNTGSIGTNGGSGGGSGNSGTNFGGQGVSGQGNMGGGGIYAGPAYGGGGGGGGGTVGITGTSTYGGTGGAGVSSDISGLRTAYTGGGGGAGYQYPGAGGSGGGGSATVGAENGGANTGGGGGAYDGPSGSGGSGVVIVSYPDTFAPAASTTGSPTVTTSGAGSLKTTGASGNYISYSNQSGFAFATGDFTIEFSVYFEDATSAAVLYDSRPAGGNGAYPAIYINSNTIRYYTNSTDVITSSSVSSSVWYHVAVSRVGTNTRMFVNGMQAGSTYTDTTNYLVGADGPVILAQANSRGFSGLYGNMTNIRVVKGTGLYTSNFTPSNQPLTPVSGTTLLLNCASGSQYADSSGNNLVANVTGAPNWNALSPIPTGAGYKNRVYRWTSSGSITF